MIPFQKLAPICNDSLQTVFIKIIGLQLFLDDSAAGIK